MAAPRPEPILLPLYRSADCLCGRPLTLRYVARHSDAGLAVWSLRCRCGRDVDVSMTLRTTDHERR